MASLTAADLQRRHALEGAPDPFPSLNDPEPTVKPKQAYANGHAKGLDNSEVSFPSLSATPTLKPSKTPSSWGSSSNGIRKSAVNQAPVFSSIFTLPRVELTRAGHDDKHITMGSVMKDVMAKTKTKIEASSQRTTGATTFHIKGDSERAVQAATKHITAALSPHVTLVVNAPLSTIGTIIGPKGATLKKMREETGNSIRVDIPRRDTPNPSEEPTVPDQDEDEEQTLPITISGPASLAEAVRTEIIAIISTKKSKSTQRVRDVPAHILPFVSFKKTELQTEDIAISINEKDREVVIIGEREAVVLAIEAVKAAIKDWEGTLESIDISLPKRQHRLLTGKVAEELIAQTHCAVIPTKPDEPGDIVTLWGKSEDISGALGPVYQKAKSQYTQQYALPGSLAYATQIQTYLIRSAYLKTLLSSYPSVTAHVSSPALAAKVGVVHVDFIGEKAQVEAVVKQLADLVRNLEGALREIEIDWLVHKVLIGKAGKKIQQFQEQHNVLLFFPPESSESPVVLLVHDPLNLSPTAPSPVQKQAHLDDVQKELLKMAADAADVKSEIIKVESKWHSAVVGKSGTTLNAIIGEDKVLSIKVGSQAKLGPSALPLGQDDILIRGPSSEVDRAVREINKIVEDAKNDEIDNGYSVEFEINREYVGRIVGTGGAAANKLRETLGVSLDFSDDNDEKEADGKSKKKKTGSKCHIKITGRKENAEEAKRHILAQVEKLADETSEILKIPRSIHSSLIGISGKYVIRLEEKYSVKITFPRETSEENGLEETKGGRPRELLKSDEVLVRGGKKGVAGAKAEILEAVEYEKDNSNTAKFTVPARAIPRILGRGGNSINTIKDETGAQIDIDKPAEGDGGLITISLRGNKKAIAAAKDAILAISAEVSDEATIVVNIETKYHRNIIGSGGQHLRELISQAGGPTDPRAQAGLIHFPRDGEPADEVRLRGPKAVVTKLKAALEKIAADHRDRIVLGVAVPASQHRALIGRGGQNLNDLQSRTGVTVQFPGSRSYGSVGEPKNLAELGDVDPADLVKVFGPSASCAKAIAELSALKIAPETKVHPTKASLVTKTVSVPVKYHHAISQQGNFMRNLRSFGVNIEWSQIPEKPVNRPPPSTKSTTARIDEPAESEDGVEWQVVPNYQDAEEGDAEWIFKGRDDESLERALGQLAQAIDRAKAASHVGYLTLTQRSAFPKIVGTKGATVARLRAETGTDITVGREDNTIIIIGAEQALRNAKEAILKIANNSNRGW